MFKLIAWGSEKLISFNYAVENDMITILHDVHIEQQQDEETTLLMLQQNMDGMVNTFENTCSMFTHDEYTLAIANLNNGWKLRYLYSTSKCKWIAIPEPDVFKNVNVTALNHKIAEIEKWVGQAYQPDDEVGIAIEAIKTLAKV